MNMNLNIRKQVKEHLKKREYKKALNFLEDNCSENDKVYNKLKNTIAKYNNIEKEFREENIDSTSYYYKMNQIVMETLDITDEIAGEPSEEDWDFIDELVSSLKFNLVKKENEKQDQLLEKTDKDAESSRKIKIRSEDKEKNIKSKILKLAEQLNKYEEKELNVDNHHKKAKYRDIIDAINNQISEYLKELKTLS